MSKTKKLTVAALFVAIGLLTGTLIYIPIGASKCFAVQHAINVMCAVFLGPAYSLLTSFCISLGRNLLGTGSIMAFPGSMVGALLSSVVYCLTKSKLGAAIGEVVGTGVLGGLLCVPISKFLLGTEVGALAYVIPFFISSAGGAIVGFLIVKSTEILRLSKRLKQ